MVTTATSRSATGRPARRRPAPQPVRRPAGPSAQRARRPPRSTPQQVRRRPSKRGTRLGQPQRRARMMFAVVCLTLLVFAGQLLRLQTVDAPALARQALGARLVSVQVGADRGQIIDRSGGVMATSLQRYNVTVDQKVIGKYEHYVKNPQTGITSRVTLGVKDAAPQLARVLKLPLAQVTAAITGDRRFAYVAKGVTPAVWRQVDSLPISGVNSERASERYYPANGVGASVVGFVGKDGTALGGLELQLNDQLRGQAGSITYQRDPAGRLIPTTDIAEQPARPGRSYQLTIDRDLQWKAEQLLAAQVAKTGAASGVAVVMARDGRVLALANAPSFNPNDLTTSGLANLSNRALSEVYEPGSTSKIMTAAAVLEEKAVTTQTGFTVPGQIHLGGSTFHDSHAHGEERLNLAGILAKSSNIGTIMAGSRISPDTLYSYLTKFGIGQSSGMKFPGESRGILAAPGDWSQSQRYTIMFGQGLSVNALQVAGVYQAIANDGLRMPPRFVAAASDADGRLQPTPGPTPVRVVSPATAKTLRVMLEGVVSSEGTAPLARIPGYRVAGKTGTAQRSDPSCGCYRGFTGSFVGFAPADNPQLIVAITLQSPVNGHSGGQIAAPVFHDLMSYSLQKLQVPPTGTTAPKLSLTPANR
jgi:cell division protein FtsI (penicillin-binding protein 3)